MMKKQSLIGIILVVAVTLVLVNLASAQQEKPQQTITPPVYDEKADAKILIADAVAKAKVNNKRVLILWGNNWYYWCIKLNDAITEEPRGKPLDYE